MEEPVPYPKTLEDAIYSALYWTIYLYRDLNHPAINETLLAEAEVYKTAPRNEHELKMLIALKTEQVRQCLQKAEVYGSADMSIAELGALKRMLYLVRRFV